MSTYRMDVANFNLTYGKDELPMLEHFVDYIYPAFKSNLVRKYKDSTFSFYDVKVVDTDLGLALTGALVMDTKVNVLSVLDTDTRQIREKKVSYPTAPYSLFYIFLKNHRMIFIPNQKGSPRLSSFSITARYVLKEYRKEENKRRKKKGKRKLPVPDLRVIGVSSKKSVNEKLAKVEKITSLTVRFFPLNGEDFPELSAMGDNFVKMMEDIRKSTGSRTANSKINSPKNKENVAKLVDGLSGMADPTMEVTYRDGHKGKIKNEVIAQRIEFELEGDHSLKKQPEILQEARKVETLSEGSALNRRIYEDHLSDIKGLK